MTNKATKYGLMIIAAVLLVALAFAGAASADTVSIGSAEQWNAFAGDPANYGKNISISNSFSFDGVTPIVLGNKTNKYLGNISGNGYTISNFVINAPGVSNIGLIGYFSGTYIKNLTLSNFLVSGGNGAGGLVGGAYSASGETHIENVRVEYGNISGAWSVGGLVGFANDGSIWVNGSRVERMFVSGSSSNVGGLVGGAYFPIYVKDSVVNTSEIKGSGQGTGGLVGEEKSTTANNFITNSSVKDCKVWASGNYVGGLVGIVNTASKQFEVCRVENCTISGGFGVGGLDGYSNSTSSFTNAWVNYTWVGGSTNVGSIVGFNTTGKSVSGNPIHTKVYNSTGSGFSTTWRVSDNAFNKNTSLDDAFDNDGVGSRVGKTLFAGKDYGQIVYLVTVNSAGHGTASATQSSYAAGTTVELTATPNAGYHFDYWTTDNPEVTIVDNKFTMPRGDITVTAHFSNEPVVIDTLEEYLDAFTNPIVADITYYIRDGSNPWTIPSLHNGTDQFVFTKNVTLDFTGYTGGFTNVLTSGDNVGALFGNVNIKSGKTLEINGLNLTSVSVTSDGGCIGGIIGRVSGSGSSSRMNITNCNLVNCSINGIGSNNNVGGLVGYALETSVNVEYCKAMHCDVVSYSSVVGGLVGGAGPTMFVGCNVMNSTVASTGGSCVGGLVGGASPSSFAMCGVENTSVYAGSWEAGGLIGDAWSAISTPFMSGCMVKNCVVASAGDGAGGLVCYPRDAINNGISDCHVENCTIVGGNDEAAGLVGGAGASATGNENSIEYSAVKGIGTIAISLDCGYGRNLDCTADLNTNFIYNKTATTSPKYEDTITLYNVTSGNVKQPITSLSSSVVGTTFWKTIFNTTGYNESKFGGVMQQVTYLGNYGTVGGYGAGSAPMLIYDANGATGTVPASKAYGSGSTVTVAGQGDLSKSGYTFRGWYNESTGLVTAGSTFTITTDVTLYANWTHNPQYTPSSSKQTGSTVILSEGQTAPTPYATATPTVAPTAKPTEKPAIPTVIATAKPTTQATQQSPAPFLGILAGLGAAAVLLRLRK